MNISYSWLKEYINIDLEPQKLDEILTQTGLEIGGIEEVETIKGGLKGLVVGHVLTCQPHSDSDHLSVTTVDVGQGEPLPIVCGAPNIAAGQKVIVATVGTILYDGDKEFKIKKSKIRGEVSMGMICAEDEIGVGQSHDGIMVLPEDTVAGTEAADYFGVKSDYQIEVDLTPNRIDGASHIGVARDLAAYLKQTEEIEYTRPSVDAFAIDNTDKAVAVEVENNEACPRYAGLTISGVKIEESPEWLKQRLAIIGLTPVNNVVDVTNFVLHECGQPLHAFDLAEVKGDKIVVKTAEAGTKFTTLDDEERELHQNDLMICNAQEGMCIAGVFGGAQSGVKETTTDIFLESAYFNPVYVRKTARRHGLNTDASFRFERGVDPNQTIWALKRAALLIKEVAGGTISSEIVDIIADENYGKPFEVSLSFSQVKRLIGVDIPAEKIKNILTALEIEIVSETAEGLELKVPAYRVDVQREVDVIEDILRIYGYNNVEMPTAVNSTIQYSEKPDRQKLQNIVSDQLSAVGFNEIMNNSLTKANYYEELEGFNANATVNIYNPLSIDLNAMRQSLIFGGLENVAYNINRKQPNLKFYEFGNTYFMREQSTSDSPADKYFQESHIGIWMTGDKVNANWCTTQEPSTFFQMKAHVENILRKVGVKFDALEVKTTESGLWSDGLVYAQKGSGKVIAQFGYVASELLKTAEIKQPVFYADLNWDNIMLLIRKHKVSFVELHKYPEVKRDLALLINKSVTFEQIKTIAQKVERKLLRNIDLFDIYEGDKLPEGKKSYAVSFILRDDEKTLKDKQIDKIMQKMIKTFENELGAQLR